MIGALVGRQVHQWTKPTRGHLPPLPPTAQRLNCSTAVLYATTYPIHCPLSPLARFIHPSPKWPLPVLFDLHIFVFFVLHHCLHVLPTLFKGYRNNTSLFFKVHVIQDINIK